MTLLPLVYRKFFPLGSPPKTIGWPLCVRGSVEYMYSKIKKMVQIIKKYFDVSILYRRRLTIRIRHDVSDTLLDSNELTN